MSSFELNGLKVVELGAWLPVPTTGRLLQLLGAQVTKVERPGTGDPIRSRPHMFRLLNDGKRLLALDLKSAAGLGALRVLLGEADILLDGLRPGALDRLGLSAAALAALNPRLAVCALSGYGTQGPKAKVAGHDINYQAEAGAIGLLPFYGRDPATVMPFPLSDLTTPFIAITEILLALAHRKQHGAAPFIDLSLTGAAFALVVPKLVEAATVVPPPYEDSGCYGVFATGDGRHLAVGVLEDHLWQAFVRHLDPVLHTDPRFVTMEQRRQNASELRPLVARCIAHLDGEAITALLNDSDACVSQVRTPAECSDLAVGGSSGFLSRWINAGLESLRAAPGDPGETLPSVGCDNPLDGGVENGSDGPAGREIM